MARLIDADKLREHWLTNGENEYIYDTNAFLDSIDEQPTVDAVEVVHGRWKDGECTICGFDIRDMIDGESEFRSWVWDGLPYCPYCGAKMDGGNEDG